MKNIKKFPDCFSALKATVIAVERTIGDIAYFEVRNIENDHREMCFLCGINLTQIHRWINNETVIFLTGLKNENVIHVLSMTEDSFGLCKKSCFSDRTVISLARITKSLNKMTKSERENIMRRFQTEEGFDLD